MLYTLHTYLVSALLKFNLCLSEIISLTLDLPENHNVMTIDLHECHEFQVSDVKGYKAKVYASLYHVYFHELCMNKSVLSLKVLIPLTKFVGKEEGVYRNFYCSCKVVCMSVNFALPFLYRYTCSKCH